MNVLDGIVADIRKSKQYLWNGFTLRYPKVLRKTLSLGDDFLIIAEMKKASPSKGMLVSDYNPIDIARVYADSGIGAFSILTEEKHFMGSMDDLKAVREKHTDKVILRKDFIVHPFQVWETYESGADVILLIVALLNNDDLKVLYSYARDLGLSVLVEVHDEEELERLLALNLNDAIIGVNNRNLKTLKIDVSNCFQMFRHIPKDYKVIAESGFEKADELVELKREGFFGVLIGHSILLSENRREFLTALREAIQ